MFSAGTVITENPIPQTLINAMYRYYEKNQMTVGELYMLLKMIVSNLEDELDSMGMLDALTPNPCTGMPTNK